MKTFKTKIQGKERKFVMGQGHEDAIRGYERISPYKNCRREEAWYAGYDKALTIEIVKKLIPTALNDAERYKEQVKDWMKENAHADYSVDVNGSFRDRTLTFIFVFENAIDAMAFKLQWN